MPDPWRNAAASTTLLSEINARWPRRDKTSDGTIGDAAHASRSSDHNPWVKKAPPAGMGVVRARDIDVDGVDMAWLTEHLRRLGAAGDPRLTGGGYVIFNRRITSPDFTGWRTYTGTNPHTHHAHVSLTRDPAAFDSTAGWGISAAAAPPVRPTLRRGAVGEDVRVLQRRLKIADDGRFGPATERAVEAFQTRAGLLADGIVGPRTWKELGV